MSLEDHDTHPGDHRWNLGAGGGFRPSIAVISRPDEEELYRRRWDAIMRDDRLVERVPFGFGRELLLDDNGRPLCGFPHQRNPKMFGGCNQAHGHDGPHKYPTGGGPRVGIRPDTTRHNGGHVSQRPGYEEPPA